MTSYPLEGGCSCGAVRYRLSTAPMITHCCHCRMCQRQRGSAFAVNALIEADRVALLAGAPVRRSLPTESGAPLDDYVCADCGVSVWSDYGRRAVMLFVRTGTLDDPGALPPDIHIFTRSKPAWVVLPPDARAFEIYYDMAEEWPAESLARREALLGGR
jgi:hypothetical protein